MGDYLKEQYSKREQIEKALEDEKQDALNGGAMACGRVLKLQEELKQEIIEESEKESEFNNG